ncbi:hypothetical protein Pmani_017782 [Petrolisthes manimaculis]|uniref:Uncharacterized protein n=1 Tax=Petrolisthes manimaculis TaxID=1843537 RepID=A0AAE1U5G9_9EUCA|nr:hypothetical protein Pmani_017782 [Petrolisthes manimaculis]
MTKKEDCGRGVRLCSGVGVAACQVAPGARPHHTKAVLHLHGARHHAYRLVLTCLLPCRHGQPRRRLPGRFTSVRTSNCTMADSVCLF